MRINRVTKGMCKQRHKRKIGPLNRCSLENGRVSPSLVGFGLWLGHSREGRDKRFCKRWGISPEWGRQAGEVGRGMAFELKCTAPQKGWGVVITMWWEPSTDGKNRRETRQISSINPVSWCKKTKAIEGWRLRVEVNFFWKRAVKNGQELHFFWGGFLVFTSKF